MALKILAGLLAVLAVFWVVTLWRAARNEAAAEARFPPEGRLIEVEGVTVHAVVEGSGPDVVLIHGASGNTRDMTFSLSKRLARDFRVITFDRPGLGYTEEPDAAGSPIRDQAALLAHAAAELGATRPVVVGQSLGGAVALAWGVYQPQALSALVLLAAPAHRWPGGLSPYYRTLSHPVFGPLLAPLLTAWVPESYVRQEIGSIFAPQSPPEGYAEAVGAGLTLRRASLLANALHRRDIKEEVTEMARHYGTLTMPIEVLHGTADDTVYFELHSVALAREVDSARLTPLEGIGHMPHHVAQDETVAAIHRAAARAGLTAQQ